MRLESKSSMVPIVKRLQLNYSFNLFVLFYITYLCNLNYLYMLYLKWMVPRLATASVRSYRSESCILTSDRKETAI